eukprot:gb/GEZN01008951.1/.p1 GENE.gb/GEZN01008951.1/~~gb/GEZN01008951.1/.p1  ORF type:complete len:384 (-),score=63.46 gb/GEZN01008951.1/:182-1333(-)
MSDYGGQFKGKVVMVTGGAGYIGSHTSVLLLNQGARVIVVDNLANSCEESMRRVKKITGKSVEFYKADLCDLVKFEQVWRKVGKVDAVIHMAGLKAVGESVAKPLYYYEVNLVACINLMKMMAKYQCFNFVFSSSATVYGLVEMPVTEAASLSPTNPYGWTKFMQEVFLRDAAAADPRFRVVLLRYFNPVGAHPSGLIGEDPQGTPNNLLPYILQVAVGRLKKVSVFGADYETKDGTGMRDYIHVLDLGEGHLAALANGIWGNMKTNCEVYNLGTGQACSVLEAIAAVEKASGKVVPYEVVGRREGDIGECYANPIKAETELKWKAQYSLESAVADGWRWQQMNPQGFRDAAGASPTWAATLPYVTLTGAAVAGLFIFRKFYK